jgi:hypothetical protein
MTKKTRTRHRRHRKHKRHQKGGTNGSYTSASTYGTYVNGPENSQFERTFASSGEYGNRIGTEYIGAQGQGINSASIPTAQNLSLIQSAGKRRFRSRRKRGGFIGPIINQAIAPGVLLALQQTYRRNKHHEKSRKVRFRKHH